MTLTLPMQVENVETTLVFYIIDFNFYLLNH